MIIEPKATRETDTPVDPRKRLDINIPEKLSRLPLYFVMLVTGIALYLKSALPTQAATPPAEPDYSGDKESASVGRFRTETAEAEVEIDEMTTQGVAEEPVANTVMSSGSNWDTNFRLPDAPSLAFASVVEAFSPQLAPFFPVAFGFTPQNDNAAPARTSGNASNPSGRPAGKPASGPGTDNDDGGDEVDNDNDDDAEGNPPSPQANRAPFTSGPVRLHDVFAGQVVLIGLAQLLHGAGDADGNSLSINDITVSGGTLAQVGGGWSLTTLPGMLGTVTFTYDISDGLIEIIQTAMLEIVRKVHELTADDDVYVGTIYDDDIDGLFGDDLIDARAGNDVVVGGEGADTIVGGEGNDQLSGGLGDDFIFGGAGNDVIGGGDGDDQLFGDEGDDIIDGDAGDDLLMGGVGDDVLDGGIGTDSVHGEDGDDIADGGDGDDAVTGGLGDDVINGGAGSDSLEGNEGNDFISAGADDDQAIGGDGDDLLSGDAGADRLEGNDGNDIVEGGEGNDLLFGNAGADTMRGGDGDDAIEAGEGNDRIEGDSGNDRLDGGEGRDVLDYSGFTAEIYIDLANGTASSAEIGVDLVEQMEEVIGGAGDDIFVVGGTATVLSGGEGDDLFIFAVSGDDATLSQQIVHEILDFVVGDRIRVADYDVAHRERTEEERFEDLYEELSPGLDGGLPIRVHHERYDDMDHTVIEADLDRNDVYEISITVHGVLLPLTVEPIVA